MSLENNCYLSVYGVFRSEFNIEHHCLQLKQVPAFVVSVVGCCNA